MVTKGSFGNHLVTKKPRLNGWSLVWLDRWQGPFPAY
jgi:hypothetical protein